MQCEFSEAALGSLKQGWGSPSETIHRSKWFRRKAGPFGRKIAQCLRQAAGPVRILRIATLKQTLRFRKDELAPLYSTLKGNKSAVRKTDRRGRR
jgi:hypothetical protein